MVVRPTRPSLALPFLALPGLAFLAKNATVWNAYLALSAYGWPRVYRRVLEHTRTMPAAERRRINVSIKQAIRVPGQATQILTESHVGRFLQNYVDNEVVGKNPSLVVAFAKTLLERTTYGKVKKVMDNSKKRAK